jgi:hypothetical protein
MSPRGGTTAPHARRGDRRNVMKMKVGAAALLISVMTIDRAFAGYFNVVPEFDGSSSIAVIALLASVGALIWARNKS